MVIEVVVTDRSSCSSAHHVPVHIFLPSDSDISSTTRMHLMEDIDIAGSPSESTEDFEVRSFTFQSRV